MGGSRGMMVKGRLVVASDGSQHLVMRTFTSRGVGMVQLLGRDGRTTEARKDTVDALLDPTGGGKGALLRVVLANRRAQESGGGGLSLRCNTDFHLFQYRPLVKFRGESGRRLLIADETGIGKTVETGYILTEEFAAGRANRVLIMAKSRSVWKWQREMAKYFGIFLEKAVNHKTILDRVNDPNAQFHLICTHDVGRNTRGWWNELEGELDILVIDEVHGFVNRGTTHRRPLADALSGLSHSVVGLTATPVRTGAGDIFSILELIVPDLADSLDADEEMSVLPLVNGLCRALESEDRDRGVTLCGQLSGMMPSSVTSDSRFPTSLLSVDPPWDPLSVSSSIMFLRDLSKISRHMTRARGRDPDINQHNPRVVHPTHWIEPTGDLGEAYGDIDDLLSREFYHIHRQQLSSCLPATLDLMLNGARGLRSFKNSIATTSSFSYNAPALRGDVEEECEGLARRIRRMGARDDEKFEALSRLLEDLSGDPSVTNVVVFTHFLPTFSYLRSRLHSSVVISDGARLILAGPESDDEELSGINKKIAETTEFTILLTTDRMSEAVDLHEANCVVNYDLPYNPQDLQQRIGRVDRIVQKADCIHVHNFAVRGTVDEAIVERIIERSEIFEGMVGGMEDVADEMASSACTRAEIGESMGRAQDELTRRALIEGEAFRFVDSIWDEDIASARDAQSPFLSMEPQVFLEAFGRLRPGGRHNWDGSTGTLRLEVEAELVSALYEMFGRKRGMSDEMRKAMSEAFDSGFLSIKFGGREGFLGPLDDFSKWITLMLCAIEGCDVPISESLGGGSGGQLRLARVSGSRVSESVWLGTPEDLPLSEWLDSIGSVGVDGVITPVIGYFDLANDARVSSLIDRERAEGDRLRRASIRRMYARRRWYEDNPDVPKAAERVASLTDEIERAESADDPPEAVVELVHEVLGVD